jgi:hypothetical protein
MAALENFGEVPPEKSSSLSAREMLARCLLILNSFVFALVLWQLASPFWPYFGVRFLDNVRPAILCLYFVCLFGFPISVICLRGFRRPRWVTVALFVNAPFYTFQLLFLVFGVIALLGAVIK